MDRAGALKAIRKGAIAAIISGTVTLFVVGMALFSDAEGNLAFWNDPFNLIDVLLIFFLAFGIYRKSRTAAVLLFIYFMFAKIFIALSVGRMQGLLVSLIFLYFYARAIQGTFVFHRLEKQENPDYKTSSVWYLIAGIPLGLCFLLALGFGMLTVTGAFPSTEVLAGDKVPANQVATLVEHNIVESEEEIAYFYSAGMFSILVDGNLLTDRRVVSYFKNAEGELEIYDLYFTDIEHVELVQQGNLLTNSVYQINAYAVDTWFQIVLSAEAEGDKKFIAALQQKILDARQ